MQDAVPLTQGKYMRAFEAAFSEFLGGDRDCFAVCNATAALELCAQLCQFEEGDEFVIPGHTYTSSAYPFIKKGGTPVWADIDLDTKVVTAETIEACISPRTKAIIVVHLYGYVADMPAIMEVAKRHDIIVIEDSAQSIGAELNGRQSGAFGDLGVFSLHSHKNITTLGEGGILAVKNEKLAQLVRMLRHNGHCGFDFERTDYWLPAMGNVDLPKFQGEIILPNNYCLGEVECALGAKLLERLDEINAQKRKRAMHFIDALAGRDELSFHREDSTRHNYHLLVGRVTNGTRDEMIRRMSRDKKVQCIIQYYPLYRYDLYKKLGYGNAECPQTDAFYDNMISFPFHHHLTDDQYSYMLESICDVLDSFK
jgi:dTDP-4-amino-4,6-dideoxygalactose transaminase